MDRATTPDEEQSRLLHDISAQIKKHAFYLEKAMVRTFMRPSLAIRDSLRGRSCISTYPLVPAWLCRLSLPLAPMAQRSQ